MATTAPVIEARRAQMFPTVDPHDITRLKRFGESHHYPEGAALMKAGEVAAGLYFVLSGTVSVTQGGDYSRRQEVVRHGPGSFGGELAQLSDRPSLVDAVAVEPMSRRSSCRRARLRDVLVQEAELGERLMRALILRRVGLLQAGQTGPIIIGAVGSADMLRLENFLTPQRPSASDPGFRTPTPCAQTLLERFHHRSPSICPSCCARAVRSCAIPAKANWRAASAWCKPIDPDMVYDTVDCGRRTGRAWRLPSMPPPKDFRPWCWTAAASAARPGRRRGSRITWAFPPASPALP